MHLYYNHISTGTANVTIAQLLSEYRLLEQRRDTLGYEWILTGKSMLNRKGRQ